MSAADVGPLLNKGPRSRTGVIIAFRMPPSLLGILVLGVVFGFLASLLPTRRSARREVLDAINAV